MGEAEAAMYAFGLLSYLIGFGAGFVMTIRVKP